MKIKIYLLFLLLVICTGCSQSYQVPENANGLNKKVCIYPDYTDIVIPCNIAPLNFMVREKGDEFVVSLNVADDALVQGCGKEGIIQFDAEAWHSFLDKHKGESLTVTVYAKQGGVWGKYNTFHIQIATEPIDNYVSYRLIEPGYELYRQVGLYQRNLTDFEEKIIYENLPKIDKDGHCINCHSFQNYSAKNMLFHVREHHPCTIIAMDGKIEKINPKTDSTLSNAVYPAWHPKYKYVVFSSNKTGQMFHIKNHNKCETMDFASDLIFYNVETNELSNIFKTTDQMETFPTWSPQGDRLYYCVADIGVDTKGMETQQAQYHTAKQYKQVKYNIMSMPFDAKTQTFGEPRMEVNCKAMGKSGTSPRISQDGKYLLFTMGNYGQFHIWHQSADQYVKNLQTGEVYPLKAANSKNSESFHNWSSNGRWIIFTTRRDDGVFTRLYITYFDNKGQAHKAFMLPQEDPLQNIKLFKSYNVPAFTKDAVPYEAKDFRKTIMNGEPIPVKFTSRK